MEEDNTITKKHVLSKQPYRLNGNTSFLFGENSYIELKWFSTANHQVLISGIRD